MSQNTRINPHLIKAKTVKRLANNVSKTFEDHVYEVLEVGERVSKDYNVKKGDYVVSLNNRKYKAVINDIPMYFMPAEDILQVMTKKDYEEFYSKTL